MTLLKKQESVGRHLGLSSSIEFNGNSTLCCCVSVLFTIEIHYWISPKWRHPLGLVDSSGTLWECHFLYFIFFGWVWKQMFYFSVHSARAVTWSNAAGRGRGCVHTSGISSPSTNLISSHQINMTDVVSPGSLGGHFRFKKLSDGSLDKTKVICNLCSAQLSYCRSITSLKYHLCWVHIRGTRPRI